MRGRLTERIFLLSVRLRSDLDEVSSGSLAQSQTESIWPSVTVEMENVADVEEMLGSVERRVDKKLSRSISREERSILSDGELSDGHGEGRVGDGEIDDGVG